MEEIRAKVSEVFFDVLKVKPERDLSSEEVRAWDSLNHVVLINAVEELFGIQFDLEDMLLLQSFEAICAAVETKLK